MSVWTHVIGAIKIKDALSCIDGRKLNKHDFDEIFKDTHNYSREDCNMPCGSDGSVYYYLHSDFDTTCLASYELIFSGELNDFDNLEEIKSWWANAYSAIIQRNLWVNDGILKARVENGAEIILTMSDEGACIIHTEDCRCDQIINSRDIAH